MSANKIPKLEDASEESLVGLKSAEKRIDAQKEIPLARAVTPLSKAPTAPISFKTSHTTTSAALTKAKSSTGANKKRKHLTIDSEASDDFEVPSTGPIKEPKHWREVVALIEEVRPTLVAPVDTVGADSLGDWDAVERGEIDAKVARFRTLLALMLSSQTKDQVTANAMANLRGTFAPLTVDTIRAATEAQIDKCIEKVGFHHRKSTYIKKTVDILHEKYDDDVPATIKEIMDLPGVGPKMGFLLMQIAWKNVIGIGVDTHVHRISNRLGWVNTKSPEETRAKLERWLPREYWGTINKTLVGFGQMICLPIGPKCAECPVSHLCPSSSVPKPRRKVVSEEE